MWVGKQVIWRWSIVAFIFLGGIFYGYFVIIKNRPTVLLLPVYGEKNADGTDHRIGDFSLVNQEGNTISPDDFEDKIYIADFFFTNCEGICPIMTDQMVRIANSYMANPNVLLLSHTVKPEEDSVSILKNYAEMRNADPKKWFFVTGEKEVINKLARNSYLVAELGDTTGVDFVHTQFFALIDPEKRVRGLYDGTDSTDVTKLIDDIEILLNEE